MILFPPSTGLRTVLAVLAVAAVVTICPAAAEDRSSLEKRLLVDVADRELNDFTLVEAGLIASGVTEQEALTSYVEECRAPVAALAEDLEDAGGRAARAEIVFRSLHREFLVGEYDERCTELTRLLDTGDYNCVSATLLYQYLCKTFELAPTAVATSTHVRSQFDEGVVSDVETTCRAWFDADRRRGHGQPTASSPPVRRLSEVQLLGKIYYNRGVSMLETQRFAEAVELLRVARRLDPQDASADENLLAAINNWALYECRRQRYRCAVNLITEGLASHPNYEPYLANDLHIHQQWATHLCRRRRYWEAFAILQRAYQRRPDVELFDRGRLAVAREWAGALWQDANDEKAEDLTAARP